MGSNSAVYLSDLGGSKSDVACFEPTILDAGQEINDLLEHVIIDNSGSALVRKRLSP